MDGYGLYVVPPLGGLESEVEVKKSLSRGGLCLFSVGFWQSRALSPVYTVSTKSY